MNPPSPAIVSQAAVRRLPRWALLLLCAVYVIPGYVGREPWKGADISSFGVMLELLDGVGWRHWATPSLMGMPADSSALLPYWLGAWAIRWLTPLGFAPDFAARLPFALMLAGTLAATWYAMYHLARHPTAQPVAFAFGGEADATDYARALADGSLLALIATLGLAQFSHETTPTLAQLFFAALSFYGWAALPSRTAHAIAAIAVALLGLTLSGAPGTALAYAALSLPVLWQGAPEAADGQQRRCAMLLLIFSGLLCALLIWQLGLWRTPGGWMRSTWSDWRALARLLLWFTWPAWPLALWTLWRWRGQLARLGLHRHLALPLASLSAPLLTAVAGTVSSDRALLLGLPALAALAAFALPTFKRSAASLIDWFTVLFFTGWAILIWVVWLSMMTGVPAKPAANVARLAPGFEPVFQPWAVVAAVLGTIAWVALARWRTGRHRTALWKSLVLPAAGATLCWLMLMSLWLPALNHGRSFGPQIAQVRQIIGDTSCVEVHGLSTSQIAAVRFHGRWQPMPARSLSSCPWLLVDIGAQASLPVTVNLSQWRSIDSVRRTSSTDETLLIFKRIGQP